MSFHGWTGGGKNYVAKFVTDSIYKLGQKSQYVHLFVSTIHFPHEQQSDIYKVGIKFEVQNIQLLIYVLTFVVFKYC